MPEQSGQEDENILYPLVQPDGLDRRAQRWPGGGKTSFNVRNAPHALYQAFITYHDGASRRSPDGQILRLISHVVEALFAEARNQRGALALAGQVLHAVAGYYAVEKIQVVRDDGGQRRIGGRDQEERASAGALRAQPAEQLAVPRQLRDVDTRVRGDRPLERGFPLRQGRRQPQQRPGRAP